MCFVDDSFYDITFLFLVVVNVNCVFIIADNSIKHFFSGLLFKIVIDTIRFFQLDQCCTLFSGRTIALCLCSNIIYILAANDMIGKCTLVYILPVKNEQGYFE